MHRAISQALIGGRGGFEAEVKLNFPPELKSCFGDGIVPILRARMSIRQVRRVRRNFVGNLRSIKSRFNHEWTRINTNSFNAKTRRRKEFQPQMKTDGHG